MADNGTVVSTMDYWPYGAMLSQTGSGDTRFKYTGHERDDESALDYMLARMYESGTGRFLQMDPLADKYPGISPYVYTAGNPLKFVDPDGRRIYVAQDKIVRTIIKDLYSRSETFRNIYDDIRSSNDVGLGVRRASPQTEGISDGKATSLNESGWFFYRIR